MSALRCVPACFVLVLAGCGDDDGVALDAAIARDAGSDTGAACSGGETVAVGGVVGQLDSMGGTHIGTGFDVCLVGHPEVACQRAGLTGQFQIEVPSCTDGVLRMARAGDWTWLRPIRPGSSAISIFQMGMGTRDLVDVTIPSPGPRDPTTGYALFLIEREPDLRTESISRVYGIPGAVIEILEPTDATIVFAADDFIHPAMGATTTTTSGYGAIVVPHVSTDELAPSTIRVRITHPTIALATTCDLQPTLNWVDSTDPVEMHAPIIGNTFTYAFRVHCPFIEPGM